ncbi:MAG: Quinolinate synthase A [Methanomicrobiales archaeon 53_19]|nr:quinolinate synthase NadA [Methanocalculus sp.]KUK70432.1 MAG: Quinolinate synthase A [Methanocalculus sp. 52_23]KUL03207.1 MAG: Quinolinate synthase A [Methanomicrobiales archaeon 53_19]
MTARDISTKIRLLAEEKNAVILAHNYQVAGVQDIADIVGDSLELARAAAERREETIVFCGVDFMAETAAILSPEKTVLLPAPDAHCPMAGMIAGGDVRMLRERFPDAAVVAYVNTTAEVKAESDICCTSANALKIVESLKEDQVIMLPDRNLARYVARFTEKEILLWEGYCYVHDRMTSADVSRARLDHPDAELLVHPECRPDVIDLADYVHSTSGMIRHIYASDKVDFIIGTEPGIIHQIEKQCPGKRVYPLSEKAVCMNMKKTSLEKVIQSLETLTPQMVVPEEIAARARVAIERMLQI